MYCQTLSCVFDTQFDPSDDTWAAIQVYRDGNVHVLCEGFPTEQYAVEEMNRQLSDNDQFGVGA